MANLDIKFNGEVARFDYPMIIASNRQLAAIHGVRLAYDAAGYEAGRVVALNTVSSLWVKYDDASLVAGVAVAKAVLMKPVDVSVFKDNTDSTMGDGIFAGELFEDKLVGLDAAAKVDLMSRSYAVQGVNILKF